MGQLTTHVLDISAGLPAAGLQIEVHEWLSDSPALLATVTTGKDGRFHLTGFGRDRAMLFQLRGPNIEINTFHVLTHAEPLPGMTSGNHGTYAATFDLHALPSKPIVGTVREKGTGKPLAGITVGSMMYEHILAKTDAQGHYRIEGAGKHKEYAVAAGGSPYFNATKLDLPDTPGVEPLTVDFDLERGVAVKGRLIDKTTGKPVRGRVGWLALPDNPNLKNFTGSPGPQIIVADEGQTKADGSFTVVTIPGPGLLTVKADDENRYPAARTEGVKTASGIILQEYHALVRVDPAENDPKSQVCDIVLEPARSLAGIVTDPDGRPLTGAYTAGLTPVTQLFQGVGAKMATASFTLGGLRPGQPRALFFIHPEKKLAKVAKIRGDEKEPLTIRLEPLGTFTGRILDAGGRPWAGLKVTLRYDIGELEAARLAAKDYDDLPWELLYEYPAWHKVINREGTTNADGRFRIEGVVPGLKYDLAASTGEGEGAPSVYSQEGLSVDSGKTTDLGELKSKEAPGK
jgi:hypothetical protein